MAQSRKTETETNNEVKTEFKVVGGSEHPAEANTAAQATSLNGAEQQAAEPKPEVVKPVSAGITAAKLRIKPNAETTKVQRILTKIPVVDKPDPQWYVRIRPGAEWRMEDLGIVKFHRDRRLYAIDPKT